MKTERPKKERRSLFLPWQLLFTEKGVSTRVAPGEAPVRPKPIGDEEGRDAFWVWMVIGVALILAAAVCSVSLGRSISAGADVAVSGTVRNPLQRGAVRETGYYTDNLGWIGNKNRLLRGMKYFYEKTGVQPYLYLTNNVGGILKPSVEDMERYANSLYNKLFTDDGHVLLVVYANRSYGRDYSDYLKVGKAAEAVIDEEAEDILLDYIDAYYYNATRYSEGTRDRMFADVFRDTAMNIMQLRSDAVWRIVLAGAVLIILLVAAADIRRAYRAGRRKAAENKRNELILEKEKLTEAEENSSLDDFLSKYAGGLGKKNENRGE